MSRVGVRGANPARLEGGGSGTRFASTGDDPHNRRLTPNVRPNRGALAWCVHGRLEGLFAAWHVSSLAASRARATRALVTAQYTGDWSRGGRWEARTLGNTGSRGQAGCAEVAQAVPIASPRGPPSMAVRAAHLTFG